MSKSPKRHSTHRYQTTLAGLTPLPQQEKLASLYHARCWPEALSMAEKQTQQYPQCPFAWKALGSVLLESGQWAQSLKPLDQALHLAPNDAETHNTKAQALYRLGRATEAVDHLETALVLKPDFKQARLMLIKLYNDAGGYQQALEQVAIAECYFPGDDALLSRKAHALTKLTRFGEAISTHETIVARSPDDHVHLSNLASAYRSVGRFREAEAYYLKALELAPHQDKTYSNYLMSMHYNPEHSAETLFEAHRQWDARFQPRHRLPRPQPTDCSPHRRLRIGMISAGFRVHPVGQMITSAIEALPPDDFELFAYTMNDQVDTLTRRMQQRVDHWQSVTHMQEDKLAEMIRGDRIDILLDLCGHTEGSRLLAIAHEPAPLQVKWVGGLINTTGLSAMDYLLSDAVETPVGVDDHYVEKLIRMPDDYICYMPRGNAPDLVESPVNKKSYITFGCFNNPSKLNDTLLGKWASIMRRLPNSRLFLKGMQFDSEEFCERISSQLEALGIARNRLTLEGHSEHYRLLEAYNSVDIALDSWPYSGGLTTCEALLMGVPVITYPGPTFAGRHSASHLTHAGLPELVADSWEKYEQLAVELASDIENLSTIRQGLRQQLKGSPVCDYRRFAKHFTNAMRAIWQRYCEGKAPAALTLDKEGQAWFDGDSQPMQLLHPEPAQNTPQDGFKFGFKGKIITLDHGATLVSNNIFNELQQLDAFATIAFDPANKVADASRLQEDGELHHYPHVALGDGREGTLFACLDPAMTATLEPLPSELQLPDREQTSRVLAKLPINTLRLDDIQGLESIDWLLLDNMNDSLKILEHGEKALENTLLVQVRVNFTPTHKQQPELTQISHWLARHGFSFYRLNNLEHHSHLPKRDDLLKQQATQLIHADAIFIPNTKRMDELTDNQRLKLAFVLHTVYGIQDLANKLLSQVSEEQSHDYLVGNSFLSAPETVEQPHTNRPENPIDEKPSFSLPEAPFMSEAERAMFKRSLEEAKHYFEFGSGGSTVWAVREGLTVKGVESDAKWVNALKSKLGEHCQVKAVNIGPTGEWGYPLSMAHGESFPDYSRAIYQHDIPFDLILVDGRFRVACTITAIQHILDHHESPENARIFIHDFWNRPQYHAVMDFLEPLKSEETAGLFKVKSNIERSRLKDMWEAHARQPA